MKHQERTHLLKLECTNGDAISDRNYRLDGAYALPFLNRFQWTDSSLQLRVRCLVGILQMWTKKGGVERKAPLVSSARPNKEPIDTFSL